MADLRAGVDRALVSSPTGTGKTELMFLIAKNYPRRLLVFPGRDLTDQTLRRARQRWPDANVDLEMGFSRADGGADTVVATAQSLMSRDRYQKFVGKCDIVCVDEAHWGFTARQNAMLDEFIREGAKVVGLTATPYVSAKGGILSWWDKLSFDYSIREATNDGYLVPSVVTRLVCTEMDLSAFKAGAASDYNGVELDRILTKEKCAIEMASAVAQHYDDKCSIVFCHSVKQAEMMREILLRRYGIPCSLVHSDERRMKRHEREQEMTAFFDGVNKVILNVGCLILGFDWPKVRCVFMCKATASRARYTQMYGRGTRPLPGLIDNPTWTSDQRKAAIKASDKPDFRVFDLVDNARSHTLQTSIDLLAPEASDEVKRAVGKRTEGRRNVSSEEMDAIVAEEMREEARRLATVHALEHARRTNLVGHGTFDASQHDPYLPASERYARKFTHVPFGAHKGKPITAVPTWWLEWYRGLNKSGAFPDAVVAELGRRASRSREERQSRTLRPQPPKAVSADAVEEYWALLRREEDG